MEHYDRIIKNDTNLLKFDQNAIVRYKKYLNKTCEFY